MKKYIYMAGIATVILLPFGFDVAKVSAVQHHLPVVETFAVTNVTSTTATLNGWVRGYGSGNGHAWFEYGSYENVGNESKIVWYGKAGVRGITGATAENFSARIINLKPNTNYYVRVRGENFIGNNAANIMSFKTLTR